MVRSQKIEGQHNIYFNYTRKYNVCTQLYFIPLYILNCILFRKIIVCRRTIVHFIFEDLRSLRDCSSGIYVMSEMRCGRAFASPTHGARTLGSQGYRRKLPSLTLPIIRARVTISNRVKSGTNSLEPPTC